MRQYSEEEQRIIKSIIKHSDGFHLGYDLINDLFSNDGIALVILDEGRASLLSLPIETEKVKSAKLHLFSILSLMEHLEREQMIYCIDKEPVLSLYMSSQNTSLAIAKGKYSCDGAIIEDCQGQCIMKDAEGRSVMKGNYIDDSLCHRIRHFFIGDIYATSRLHELVNNQFKSLEILQYEKDLDYARKSLWVSWGAFAISILSVVFSIPLSNKFGTSTMIESQYQGIIDKLSKIDSILNATNSKLDTAIVMPAYSICLNKKVLE